MTITQEAASPETVARLAYTRGLRRIADLLDEHPDLPLPYEGTDSTALWFVDSPEQLAVVSKAMGGTRTKKFGVDFAGLEGSIGGYRVQALVPRDQVCTRRQIGTELVKVPDPNAPKITVERPVYETDCAPLLAAVSA